MKPIKDFDDYYITEDGKVFSSKMKKLKQLKTFYSAKGKYESIKLCKNNTTYHKLIHRLVAEAYVENSENKPEVHHIDKNTHNNHKNNLIWYTRKENLNDSYETLSPVRNFINCYLINIMNNEIIDEFQSKKDAARYASKNLGCSFHTMYRYQKADNYKIIKKV